MPCGFSRRRRLGMLLLVWVAFQPAQAEMPTDAAAEADSYRVVRAALQLRDVSLRVHATCAQAAPQPWRALQALLRVGLPAHVVAPGCAQRMRAWWR